MNNGINVIEILEGLSVTSQHFSGERPRGGWPAKPVDREWRLSEVQKVRSGVKFCDYIRGKAVCYEIGKEMYFGFSVDEIFKNRDAVINCVKDALSTYEPLKK